MTKPKDEGLDEVENLFPGEVEYSTQAAGENSSAAEQALTELETFENEPYTPKYCGLCSSPIDYGDNCFQPDVMVPDIPTAHKSEPIYHAGCVVMVLRQYQLGWYQGFTKEAPSPTQGSSILLAQNTKREYHHEIKLYFDAGADETEISAQLSKIQRIARRHEELGSSPGRYEVDPEDVH